MKFISWRKNNIESKSCDNWLIIFVFIKFVFIYWTIINQIYYPLFHLFYLLLISIILLFYNSLISFILLLLLKMINESKNYIQHPYILFLNYSLQINSNIHPL